MPITTKAIIATVVPKPEILNNAQVNGLAPSQIEEIDSAPPQSKLIDLATAVIGAARSVAMYKPKMQHTRPTTKLLKPLPLQIGITNTKI